MIKSVELRVADLEQSVNVLKQQMQSVLEDGYQKAVEDNDEQAAARLLRAIRNKMLDESDKQFAADRLIPDAPSGNTFSDWKVWLADFASTSTSPWAAYRQALRDLPEQNGFPFSVDFPEKPEGGI